MNPGIIPDDVDHFSEISEAQILNIDSSKKQKKKNAKKPKNINEFESEESENYFSISEDEINDIETSYEENET